MTFESDKYLNLISERWNYSLPVFTKKGNVSYHRTGFNKGRIKKKSNPLWNKDYINMINIDRSLGVSKRDVLNMGKEDFAKPGFWSNPFLYTEEEIVSFSIDLDNYCPEKQYYDWLQSSEAGKYRLSNLSYLRKKYLSTNDLLLKPLNYFDSIEHHGQVLLIKLSRIEPWLNLKWVSYSSRVNVLEPTNYNLSKFYLSQVGLTIEEYYSKYANELNGTISEQKKTRKKNKNKFVVAC